MEQLQKAQLYASIDMFIREDVNNARIVMDMIINGLESYEREVTKRNSNIWLVVKSLKPEHLEEMKKLIIPEVFEDLGL